MCADLIRAALEPPRDVKGTNFPRLGSQHTNSLHPLDLPSITTSTTCNNIKGSLFRQDAPRIHFSSNLRVLVEGPTPTTIHDAFRSWSQM